MGWLGETLIVVLIGAALGLLIWGVAVSSPRVTRVVPRSFWCPFTWQWVTVDFVGEAWDGRPLGVVRCSARSRDIAPACKQLCLYLEHPPVVRDTAAV